MIIPPKQNKKIWNFLSWKTAAHNLAVHLSPLCVAFALAHFGAGSADGKKRGGSTAAKGESGWKGKNA